VTTGFRKPAVSVRAPSIPRGTALRSVGSSVVLPAPPFETVDQLGDVGPERRRASRQLARIIGGPGHQDYNVFSNFARRAHARKASVQGGASTR